MSRGPGKVERAVLDVLKDNPHVYAQGYGPFVAEVAERLGELKTGELPIQEFAKLRGRSWKHRAAYTEAFYRSVLRALRRLQERDTIYTLDPQRDLPRDMHRQIRAGFPGVGRDTIEIALNVPTEQEGNT